MGYVYPAVGAVRPSGMYFGPGKVVVCGRHLRELLQPITTYDHERGYGKGICPFCEGGPLYKQFHKYCSIKKWWFRLEMVAAQMCADRDPIEPYWDSTYGFDGDEVSNLLYDGEEGRLRVLDELYENALEYIRESEWAALESIVDELDLDIDPEELREYVYIPVEIDLLRMARNTTAYIALPLPPEHIAYWQDYDDVEEELEYFGINPADLAEYFPEIEWPDIPGRTPMLKVKDLVEGWINFNYGGYWYAMLDAEETLETVIKGELQPKMTLKKGACIILHCFANGASGMNEYTLADIEVETDEIFNDGVNHYGIQNTNGMVTEAWNGVLE